MRDGFIHSSDENLGNNEPTDLEGRFPSFGVDLGAQFL
jgi:hypothetical protein